MACFGTGDKCLAPEGGCFGGDLIYVDEWGNKYKGSTDDREERTEYQSTVNCGIRLLTE